MNNDKTHSRLPITSGRSWNRFFRQFQRDLKFWLFCLGVLELFRLAFIFYFRQKISGTSTYIDILAVSLNGLRYDSMAAGYWAIPSLLLSVACGFAGWEAMAERVRLICGAAFTIISAILFRVSIGYFQEFGDVFNHRIFELYYDNPRTILTTIAAQYELVWSFSILLTLAVIAIFGLRRFLKNGFAAGEAISQGLSTSSRQAGASLIIAFLFVGALRGSFGKRPAQPKDAAITRDEFLNKSVMDSYYALQCAVKDYRHLMSINGLSAYLPDGDITGAAKYAFSKPDSFGNLDAYMLKHAQGHKNPAARHIFLIVMESYDEWPLMDKYNSLRLTERLKDLARNGIYLQNFLPASDGTMTSLAAIITGLPDAGVFTNYRESARRPYPSSVAAIFRRLGYKTRLFYGGYLSWERIGDFFTDQGFDEVYGGAHMGNWTGNEWGVEDEYLFKTVYEKVDNRQPSFNLIMSTSYHPPYIVDVYGKGYPVKELPADIKGVADQPVDLKMLGHLWYADMCLGDFVHKAEEKLDLPVFAITGDHSGRKHVKSQPDFFEKSAVPLVLYGRNVLKDISLPKNAAGGHMDIVPTLIELAAPAGFAYHSMGNNLLAPRLQSIGYGQGRLITPEFILDLNGAPAIYPLPGKKLTGNPPDLGSYKKLYDAVYAVAWWRIMRGPEIAGNLRPT